jgi:hypothetical protein
MNLWKLWITRPLPAIATPRWCRDDLIVVSLVR